jgi:Family of unknown function (DUF6058)
VLSEADVEYIRSDFVELDELCRRSSRDPAAVGADIDRGRLPRPSYVLDDGTQMVPSDYFALADEAGGVDGLRTLFLRRLEQAAATDLEEEWQGYLSGEYGVCLKSVTPENIVRKGVLVDRIEALLAEPDPDGAEWPAELRTAVDELDELERQFADYDRVRFGGLSSRERLIAGSRQAYPAIFAGAGVEP